MTRQPGMVGLDLKCEIAANNVAKARMQDMYDRYGPELLDAVSSEMIRYSEILLRQRIADIPDGSWSEQFSIETDKNWRMKLTLAKRRGTPDFRLRRHRSPVASGHQSSLSCNLRILFRRGDLFAGA